MAGHGGGNHGPGSRHLMPKYIIVYLAPNEELVREHARLGGFPANVVSRVRTANDPTTAE